MRKTSHECPYGRRFAASIPFNCFHDRAANDDCVGELADFGELIGG